MSEDAELSALLRDTLRAHTPEGLSETQRAALLATARGRPPMMRRIARGLALLAVACGLPLAVYWTGSQDEEEPVLPRANYEDPRQVDQHIECELKHVADPVPQEAALRAAAAAKEEAERSAAARRAAGAAAASRDAVEHPRHKASKGKRRAAAKAGRGSEQKAVATGACDQGDPLCGL